MRKLIRADLNRILAKKAFWIALAIMLIICVAGIYSKISEAPDRGVAFVLSASNGISYLGLVIGLILVMSIYSDEFKSMMLISTIGRGLTREKYILAKLLDALIVLTIAYGAAGVAVFVTRIATGTALNDVEVLFIVLRFFFDALTALCSVTIAAAFFYLTENSAFGIFMFLTAIIILPVVLIMVQSFPPLARLHLDRYYMSGATSSMLTDFMIGDIAAGIGRFAFVAAVYLAGAVAAAMLVFRKKELDF